ncbi:MAG TPA: hypothetical protein VG826_27120 [Pirellulales bacterium]|nr:hypothetical protein [Pirellulales bacterium]
MQLLCGFDARPVDLKNGQAFAEIEGQPGFPLRIRHLALLAIGRNLREAILELLVTIEKVSNLSGRGWRTALCSENVIEDAGFADLRDLLLKHLQRQHSALGKIVLVDHAQRGRPNTPRQGRTQGAELVGDGGEKDGGCHVILGVPVKAPMSAS